MQCWAWSATFIVIAQNNHWSLQNMGSFPTVLWMLATRAIVFFISVALKNISFSALTLLDGWQEGIRPVKSEWWGAGMVICLERHADFHMAQLMPLPLTVSCFSKIQIGFTFLVPAHLGSPRKMAVKRVCVCCFKNVRLYFEWLPVYED